LHTLNSGEYVIHNEDKANILNNFFCSIAEIENSNVLTPDFHDRTGNRINTLHITSDEVKDILECLQLGKAVGSDLISHCMLKNTVSIICKPLQLIFNYSLQTRKFPKIWKSAIVIALFKTHQIIDLLVYLVVLGKFLNVLFSNIYLISYWRPRCQTLSKAFDISQNTVHITSRFSNDKQILW
jgi:hypothetical protein